MAVSKIKQCRKCGQVKPSKAFTGNRYECKVCEAARKKLWEARNRDHVNKLHREWAEKNPERFVAIKRRWYEENREIVSAKDKLRHQSNPEKKRAASRATYRENAAQIKARSRKWVLNNPLRAKAHWKNRKARVRNLPNNWTGDQAATALLYWRGSCAACGSTFDRDRVVHWDHWTPLIHPACPGTIALNMVPLCGPCNLTKNRRDALGWATDRFGAARASEIIQAVETFFRQIQQPQEFDYGKRVEAENVSAGQIDLRGPREAVHRNGGVSSARSGGNREASEERDGGF